MEIQKFRRGQIWWHNPSYELTGHLQGKKRPVIIVSNDTANKFSSVVNVVPCTSAFKNKIPTHVEFRMNDLVNIAMCEQITSVNTEDLVEYIGACDNIIMNKLVDSIQIALGMKDAKTRKVPTIKEYIKRTKEE